MFSKFNPFSRFQSKSSNNQADAALKDKEITSYQAEIDEINSRYNKSYKSSSQVNEFIVEYQTLLRKIDDQQEHNFRSIASIYSELAKCFLKLGQKSDAVRNHMSSARYSVKSAKYYYKITPMLEELWEPTFSVAVFSFEEASKILEADGKFSILLQVLQELGDSYTYFHYYGYAAETFQHGVDICICHRFAPSILFQFIFNAIDSYTLDDKILEAFDLVNDVQVRYQGDCVALINKSTLLNQKLMDLRIYHTILSIMAFRFSEVAQFCNANLEHNVAQYFETICDATKNNEKDFLYILTHPSKQDYYPFQIGHLKLLDRHYQNVESSLESQLPLYTK